VEYRTVFPDQSPDERTVSQELLNRCGPVRTSNFNGEQQDKLIKQLTKAGFLPKPVTAQIKTATESLQGNPLAVALFFDEYLLALHHRYRTKKGRGAKLDAMALRDKVLAEKAFPLKSLVPSLYQEVEAAS
jgi:hypothetical protein